MLMKEDKTQFIVNLDKELFDLEWIIYSAITLLGGLESLSETNDKYEYSEFNDLKNEIHSKLSFLRKAKQHRDSIYKKSTLDQKKIDSVNEGLLTLEDMIIHENNLETIKKMQFVVNSCKKLLNIILDEYHQSKS